MESQDPYRTCWDQYHSIKHFLKTSLILIFGFLCLLEELEVGQVVWMKSSKTRSLWPAIVIAKWWMYFSHPENGNRELTKKNFENIRQGGDGTELSQLSTSYDEFPILGTFDKKRKLFVPLWAHLELGATVEGKFELVNRSKEEGKADNGLLVRPKAAQEPLKEERVKTGKQDPYNLYIY